MKTKLCKSILIESKEKAYLIGKFKDTGRLIYNNYTSDINRGVPMELVLISLDPDEKIEVGDLVLLPDNTLQIMKYSDMIDYLDSQSDATKKVIAIHSQISPEYIQQFIEEYNNEEVKDVEIEMEIDGWDYNNDIPYGDYYNKFKPKLTNGFVTIVKKESITYTEEEVKQLCLRIYNYGFSGGMQENSGFQSKQHDCNSGRLWFENNKKK